jgi:hypothetical protein
MLYEIHISVSNSRNRLEPSYISTKSLVVSVIGCVTSSDDLTLVSPYIESLRLDPRASPLEAFVVSATGDNEYPNQMLESHSVGHVVLTEFHCNFSRINVLETNHCSSRGT